MEESTPTDKHDYDCLMQTYMDICNKALLFNKDRFPFKEIFEAAKNLEADRRIEVKISDCAASYIIQIKDGKIVHERHSDCPDCECDGQWMINNQYLCDVIQNADFYVANPARIDWGWMCR